MILTDSARSEIEALNQIFLDEVTITENGYRLEISVEIITNALEDEENYDVKGESPLKLKLILSIGEDYPRSSPDIWIKDSNVSKEHVDYLLNELNQIKMDLCGEEVLFCLINSAKDNIDKFYGEALEKLRDESKNNIHESEAQKILIPLNSNSFENWKKSFIQEAVNMLEEYRNKGLSVYNSYWKLPQCMRSILYIYNAVPKYILLPSDFEGKQVITGKEFMLQQANLSEDTTCKINDEHLTPDGIKLDDSKLNHEDNGSFQNIENEGSI